jgi:hypothetical protein
MMLPEVENNPFDAFDTMGMVIAFLARTEGLPTVRAVLKGSDLHTGHLGEIIDELESVGLSKVASVVEAAMETAPEPDEAWLRRRRWSRSARRWWESNS